MNGTDVDDVNRILAEHRAASNNTIQAYQQKLAFRLRTQLVKRNPVTSKESTGPIAEFTAFARWLEACGTLEGTYLTEVEGGQERFRSLQMAAGSTTELQSQQLRRVLYYSTGEAYLEEPYQWVKPVLESQLNSWRHLPAAALPLRIQVDFGRLEVEPQYKALVAPYGDETLYFTVHDNTLF